MVDESRIEKALDSCYEAVAEPEKWSSALQGLADASGAAAAMFYPKDVNENAVFVPASESYSELLEEYVRGGWYNNHYRAERGWPLLSVRSYVLEHDLATDEERRKLAHYNDLYLRWGFSGFIAIPFVLDGQAWCLPMLRDRKKGFFTHEDGTRLARLAPHFRRLMMLSEQFSRNRIVGHLEVLDQLDRPAILLTEKGRVEALNRKAEDLLARVPDALIINGGSHLHAVHTDSERRLQSLLATVRLSNIHDRRRNELAPIRIEQPDRRPLVIEAISPGDLLPGASPGALLILITDLDDRQSPSATRLRTAFKLTPAEAELCVLLTKGKTLAEAGLLLGITEGTARQRLKDVFQKTDTNRQAELVSLILRLSAIGWDGAA